MLPAWLIEQINHEGKSILRNGCFQASKVKNANHKPKTKQTAWLPYGLPVRRTVSLYKTSFAYNLLA